MQQTSEKKWSKNFQWSETESAFKQTELLSEHLHYNTSFTWHGFFFTQTDLYKNKLAACILGWNQFTGEKVKTWIMAEKTPQWQHFQGTHLWHLAKTQNKNRKEKSAVNLLGG